MSRRIPTIVTAIYLVLVLLSIIPIFTGDDPLSAIFAVVLAAPWYSLFSKLFAAPGTLVVGLSVVAVAAVINAGIIYFVVQWLSRRFV